MQTQNFINLPSLIDSNTYNRYEVNIFSSPLDRQEVLIFVATGLAPVFNAFLSSYYPNNFKVVDPCISQSLRHLVQDKSLQHAFFAITIPHGHTDRSIVTELLFKIHECFQTNLNPQWALNPHSLFNLSYFAAEHELQNYQRYSPGIDPTPATIIKLKCEYSGRA